MPSTPFSGVRNSWLSEASCSALICARRGRRSARGRTGRMARLWGGLRIASDNRQRLNGRSSGAARLGSRTISLASDSRAARTFGSGMALKACSTSSAPGRASARNTSSSSSRPETSSPTSQEMLVFEHLGGGQQGGGGHAIGPAFVLLHLLEGDAQALGQIALRQAELPAPRAHPGADHQLQLGGAAGVDRVHRGASNAAECS